MEGEELGLAEAIDPLADLAHARVPGPLPASHRAGEPSVLRRALELGDVRGRIERALRAVNLEDRARDLYGSLSKRLRQRVALARALLNDLPETRGDQRWPQR
jgi:ATPase subunit of ABC transporter with duplicated ATPase domains